MAKKRVPRRPAKETSALVTMRGWWDLLSTHHPSLRPDWEGLRTSLIAALLDGLPVPLCRPGTATPVEGPPRNLTLDRLVFDLIRRYAAGGLGRDPTWDALYRRAGPYLDSACSWLRRRYPRLHQVSPSVGEDAVRAALFETLWTGDWESGLGALAVAARAPDHAAIVVEAVLVPNDPRFYLTGTPSDPAEERRVIDRTPTPPRAVRPAPPPRPERRGAACPLSGRCG